MKFCPNCGTSLNEGGRFCSNCGTSVNGFNETSHTEYTASNNAPKIEFRNIAVAIILSIITCGIYGIIWFINMVDDVNSVSDEKTQSGGTVFLLSLVTCGIYAIYWAYKAGQALYQSGKKYNKYINDNSVLYLVLSIFGLSIVAWCLIQNDLNQYAKSNN